MVPKQVVLKQLVQSTLKRATTLCNAAGTRRSSAGLVTVPASLVNEAHEVELHTSRVHAACPQGY